MLSEAGRGGPSPVLLALLALGELVFHGDNYQRIEVAQGRAVPVIGAPKSERVSCVLVDTRIVGQIRCFGVVFTGYAKDITESDHISSPI